MCGCGFSLVEVRGGRGTARRGSGLEIRKRAR